MLKVRLANTDAQYYCDKIFEFTGAKFELGVAEDWDFIGGNKITTRHYALFYEGKQAPYSTLEQITTYLEGYLTGVINESRRITKGYYRR